MRSLRNSLVFVCAVFCAGCSSKKVSLDGPSLSPLPVVNGYVDRYGAISSPEVDHYLSAVISTIEASIAGAPQNEFRVIILDSNESIAFTPGGGYILLSRGTMRAVKNEGEFIFLLAHEIAHGFLHHTELEELYKGQARSRAKFEFQADEFALQTLLNLHLPTRYAFDALKHAYEGLSERQYSGEIPSYEDRAQRLTSLLKDSYETTDSEHSNVAFQQFKQTILVQGTK